MVKVTLTPVVVSVERIGAIERRGGVENIRWQCTRALARVRVRVLGWPSSHPILLFRLVVGVVVDGWWLMVVFVVGVVVSHTRTYPSHVSKPLYVGVYSFALNPTCHFPIACVL